MINEENKTLTELYKQVGKDTWYGRRLEIDGIYVECGKQMPQSFKRHDETRMLYNQITIRDIILDKHFQKKGLFTHFIKYLLSLENIEAVQLECVQPEWLKKRLKESIHWYKQGESENYVRFKEEEEENEKFSLF